MKLAFGLRTEAASFFSATPKQSFPTTEGLGFYLERRGAK